MKITRIFIIFFIAINSKITAQYYSAIIWDKNQSEYLGANNLIMLQKSLYLFQDKYIPDTLIKENNFLKKTLGFAYRMGKLFILDVQGDYIITLTQHEAFGHGARFREFGYKENSFHITPSIPFGNGSGFAQRGKLNIGYIITPQENIVISFAGNEANSVLSNNLTSQILLDDTLHYRQGLLYSISQNNLFFYLWSTHYTKPENIKPGNDMANYIKEINSLYPHVINKDYNLKKLCTQSLISIINPMQLYSIYTILFQYGIKGKKQLNKIPMIKMGTIRYLPLFNYNLTPFGSEYIFSNVVKHKHTLYSLDFNLGDNTFNKFYGGSLKIANLIDTKRIGINLNCNIWNQPELELENPSISVINSPNKIGGAIKVDFMIRPFKLKNKFGIFLQTGYKSKGYIMGEDLAETFILRYGISFHVN